MVLDDIPEYSTKITKEIECPFCKAKISVLYKPAMIQFHVSRIAAKTARVPYRTQERYEILSDKCPNCGKSKKEIEKALAKGKEPSNEEIVRRLREAGLDPTKLK
jgi:DNA-directed RNA polymerase subunit RPC12/RpoP